MMQNPGLSSASSNSERLLQPPTYAESTPSKKGLSSNAGAGIIRPVATIQNDDERLLARIGYKQVRCLPLP